MKTQNCRLHKILDSALEKLSPSTRFTYWMETSLYSALRWKLFDKVVAHARSFDEALRHLKDPFLLAGKA